MKARAIPLMLALAGCAAPAAVPRGGIVSTNPCADAMLIKLVAPGRIAAISHYSQHAAATSIPLEVARRFRSTAGTAEEVIALNPALVLTSSFTPLATRTAYERAGLKTLLLDSPTTIAASRVQVMQVAAAVGAEGRGRVLVDRIDAAVQSVSISTSPAKAGAQQHEAGGGVLLPVTAVPETGPRPSPRKENSTKPSALLFIGGNLANGSGTLLDELVTLSGFRNAAADYGLKFTGTLPIETIAARPPRVILTPGPSRTAALRTRVLAAMGASVTEANFPRNLVNCGGPTIIPALARLAAIRQTLL